MKNLYIDPNTGDLAVQGYNLRITSDDTEFYSQKIENTVKLVFGEYFLNRNIGVPYYGPLGLVMKKNPDLNEVQAIMVSAITGIEGISSVEKYEASFNQATRVYTASIRAITDSGVEVTREINL